MNRHNHTDRIVMRLEENKTSIKQYASYEKAAKVAESEIARLNEIHGNPPYPMWYLVLYVPSTGKFTPVFQVGKYFRENNLGGFIAELATRGFYTIG